MNAMQILAVVVRYWTPIAESQTLQGLAKAMVADPGLASAYKVLVWDNSPEALLDPQLPIPFEYRHSERNLGVSGAYNSAMEFAEAHGHVWMLLLDQDTSITSYFLHGMLMHAENLLDDHTIAAILPVVRVGKVVVSPKQQLFNRNRGYPEGVCGAAEGEAIGINSGCVMRVRSLHEIGGFNPDFWLDFSDLYVFHQFFCRGLKVWKAGDVNLDHEMSIMDYDRLMTPWRYTNFSYAETAFHDLYKGHLENILQTFRLFARAFKQRMKYKNPEFSKVAWQQWLYRIKTSKSSRLAQWHAEGLRRRAVNPASPPKTLS